MSTNYVFWNMNQEIGTSGTIESDFCNSYQRNISVLFIKYEMSEIC